MLLNKKMLHDRALKPYIKSPPVKSYSSAQHPSKFTYGPRKKDHFPALNCIIQKKSEIRCFQHDAHRSTHRPTAPGKELSFLPEIVSS